VLEDLTLHTAIVGRQSIAAYLARALPSLPYGQGAQVRHVVGGAAGGPSTCRSRSRARTPARARGFRAGRLRTPVMLRRPQHSQALPLDRQQAERVTHRGATGESPGIGS
jgi:hypothetical protein